MTIRIAILADPHLCTELRRANIASLYSRTPSKYIDTWKSAGRDGLPDLGICLIKPTSYDDEPLLAAAKFIKRNSAKIDLLLVLGDLSTTGKEEDLDVARQVFLDRLDPLHADARLSPRFGGLGIPIQVIPGNHDRYKDDYGTPGGDRFDQVFAAAYTPTNGVCTNTLSKDGIEVGIVSADFCFREGVGTELHRRYGRGNVDGIVLGELELQTRTWQRNHPEMPAIWALHFSPSESVGSMLKLEQRELIADLAKKMKVNHILCGHTHERRHETGTHPHIYCAGSVSSVDSIGEHFLHLCRVSHDKDRKVHVRIGDLQYDHSEREFLPKPISTFA